MRYLNVRLRSVQVSIKIPQRNNEQFMFEQPIQTGLFQQQPYSPLSPSPIPLSLSSFAASLPTDLSLRRHLSSIAPPLLSLLPSLTQCLSSSLSQTSPLPDLSSLHSCYLEVDEEKGVELFYYYVESERNPKDDPLLLWLSGGPGCSTISGLAFEIGPLGFDLENYEDGLPSLYYKPDSWTQVSSVIFVDSPVGTGFSYSRTTDGFQTSDTETVHRLLRFLYKWLEEHPKFKSNPLYITGSSYSGMIIPVLALEIAMAKESHGAQFNLKGYVAGNPLTNKGFERNYRTTFFHGMALISDELYESIKQSCSGDYANPSNIHSAKYLDTVYEVTKDVYWDYILEPLCEFHSPRPGQIRSRTIGRSLYNEGVPLGSSNLPKECRPSLHLLSEFWANNSTARDALGIRKGTITEWHRCKLTLPYTNDFHDAVPYHRMMTNKGYTALIYSGDHDAMISYVGTQAWIRSLNLSIVDDWRPWYANGQVAGFTRKYSNNLTFATVKGAGHTAAEYKPKECLAMIASWLSGPL